MNTKNTYYKNCDLYNVITIINMLIIEGFTLCKITNKGCWDIEMIKNIKGIINGEIEFKKFINHKDGSVSFVTNHNYKFKFYK